MSDIYVRLTHYVTDEEDLWWYTVNGDRFAVTSDSHPDKNGAIFSLERVLGGKYYDGSPPVVLRPVANGRAVDYEKIRVEFQQKPDVRLGESKTWGNEGKRWDEFGGKWK